MRTRATPGLNNASLWSFITLFFHRRHDLTLHIFRNRVPDVGILNHLIGIEPARGGRNYQLETGLLVGFDRDCLLNVVSDVGMPELHLVGAHRDVGQLESPFVVCDCVVGMIDNQRPAFHVGVKAALHREDPAAFRHPDRLGHRRSLVMLLDMRAQPCLVRIALADRQGLVEQDPRPQVRRFIGLDVVHGRIHIHDHDVVKIANEIHKGHEPTINGFDSRGRILPEGLPLFDVVKQHDELAELTVRSGIERLEQTPTPSSEIRPQ